MSAQAVTVVAPSNIALSKYWGKAAVPGNVPAVPSLSVTLAGLSTTTTLRFDDALDDDVLVLGGVRQTGRPLVRVVALVDEVRAAAGTKARVHVTSSNDFPTASGLASSASGFAALALAASAAAGLDTAPETVARLARRASASAARSLFDGFAELDGGPSAAGDARMVAPPGALDLTVLVAVTTEGEKTVSSTDGMARTRDTSPYYAAWLAEAPKLHEALKAALLRGDFSEVGTLAERSALAMHASAMAAGVVFVSGATLAALTAVSVGRREGLEAYATIDAGPHLKCLVRTADAPGMRARLEAVPGVLRVIEARPGRGARLVARGTERVGLASSEERP